MGPHYRSWFWVVFNGDEATSLCLVHYACITLSSTPTRMLPLGVTTWALSNTFL